MLHLASATHHGAELNPNSLRSLTAYIYIVKKRRMPDARCPMQVARGKRPEVKQIALSNALEPINQNRSSLKKVKTKATPAQ